MGTPVLLFKMALLPFDQFLCWKLKIATIAVCYFVIVSGSVAALFEILDIASLADDGFEIRGGFKSHWRSHVWEGWLACNIVGMALNFIMIAFSVVMIFAVKRFPTYYEYNLTKGYLAAYIIYILAELGMACYKYSWYGPNTFRLAFLVFSFLYWLVRTMMNITGTLIVHSRIKEIEYEIQYGEKKNLGRYGSAANILDSRSGYTTPGRGAHSFA